MEKSEHKNTTLTTILFGLIAICIILITYQIGNNVIAELQADNLKEVYAVNREITVEQDDADQPSISPTFDVTTTPDPEDDILDDPYMDTGE